MGIIWVTTANIISRLSILTKTSKSRQPSELVARELRYEALKELLAAGPARVGVCLL